jgi:hypothetical protein
LPPSKVLQPTGTSAKPAKNVKAEQINDTDQHPPAYTKISNMDLSGSFKTEITRIAK